MDDVELLDLAAKAYASQDIKKLNFGAWFDDERETYWNPLNDDGDALRLALALNIEYVFQSSCIVVAKVSRIGKSRFDKKHFATVDYVPEEMFASSYEPDVSHANYLVSTGMIRGKASAVRLAIVRAGAEIGKAKTNPLTPGD